MLRSFASNISLSLPLRACGVSSTIRCSNRFFNLPLVRHYKVVAPLKQPQPVATSKLIAYPVLAFPRRNLVKCSKRKGKRKTVKAVAKRFYRTGSGKLKYWPAGKNHKMLSKGFNQRRNLRKPRYANKQQLKVLNKMLSGW